MDEGAGGGEVGGNGVALAEMAGGGGEVEAESGGGGRSGGEDGDRAGGISGEAVHAVLEGFGEGVGVGERVGQVKGGRWKVAGRIKRVGYLILLAEIVGLGSGISDQSIA